MDKDNTARDAAGACFTPLCPQRHASSCPPVASWAQQPHSRALSPGTQALCWGAKELGGTRALHRKASQGVSCLARTRPQGFSPEPGPRQLQLGCRECCSSDATCLTRAKGRAGNEAGLGEDRWRLPERPCPNAFGGFLRGRPAWDLECEKETQGATGRRGRLESRGEVVSTL